MLCLAVALKDAEKAKQFLLQHGLYQKGHSVKKDGAKLLIPLSKKLSGQQEKELGVKTQYCEAALEKSPLGQGLKEKLEDAGVSRSDLEKMVFSFDTVGDVAVVEVPQEFAGKKKMVAESLLKIHKSVKVVLCKKGAMKGKFRVRELEWLAGEKRTVANYVESGVRMKLDLATCFFSPRLGTERLRIAKQVKPGEKVLVLFAGVGPFALVIAKQQPDCEVVGVELNPAAVEYFKENIKINKMERRVRAVLGDVNVVAPSLFNGWADRIVMPLPHTAHEFLDAALAAAKPGCIIHYYGFERVGKNRKEKDAIAKGGKPEKPVLGQNEADENEFIIGGEGKVLVAPVEEIVLKACRKNRRNCRLLQEKIMRPYAPGVEQKVVDFLAV